jgi:hypothetical protein
VFTQADNISPAIPNTVVMTMYGVFLYPHIGNMSEHIAISGFIDHGTSIMDVYTSILGPGTIDP